GGVAVRRHHAAHGRRPGAARHGRERRPLRADRRLRIRIRRTRVTRAAHPFRAFQFRRRPRFSPRTVRSGRRRADPGNFFCAAAALRLCPPSAIMSFIRVQTSPSGGRAVERYYLVREDILPEALVKTVRAKELLARGEAATVQEAVERAGLSRSAFYKYKDGIHPLDRLDRERIVTISMDLEHKTGVLSRVLALM